MVAPLVAAVAVVAGVSSPGPSRGVASAPQIAGSPAAPSATEIAPMCTTTNPASVLGPTTTSLPSKPVTTVVTPPGGVESFAATSSALYVDTGTQLVTYSLSGVEQRAFTLPAVFNPDNVISQPVIDPSGDIYLASLYGKTVDKFSPTGAVLWSVDPSGANPTNMFAVGTGASFSLVVSLVENSSASEVLDLSTGAEIGTFPLVDQGYVTQEADGNLLYTANGYVETVSPSGTVLSTFGAPHIESNDVHSGGGQQFEYPAQAAQGPDGTIYTADPLTSMEATSPTGILQASTTMGGALDFGGWDLALVGTTFYFQSGTPFHAAGDAISSFSLHDLTAYLNAPQAPSGKLGWGAGLETPASGNYFAPGTTPTVYATFDPWWVADAAHLELAYSFWDVGHFTSETPPPSTVVALPTTATGLADVPLTLPAADTAPGPYDVRASLLDTSTDPPTTVGTTCLPYTVGATGDALDFATLPAGSGGGGPADPRGVALNAQLGLSGLRSLTTMDWSSVLPHCIATAPTAATCGPTALTFAASSTDPYKAAYLAAQDHVAYWMQISGGEPVATALVSSGLWQADVTAIVAHYATVPSGCGACAPVTEWEPWNESNNTGWGNGATYATSVLKPFYLAVKSVEPGTTSTVIGGSTLGMAPGWWQQLVAVGGLAWLDAAGIHPYTGSNDSFDEDQNPAQIRQVQAIVSPKPLWFTESGWWSDGDYDFLSQADNMASALVWQKVLGVPVWNYFFDEGNWGNDGISFSLIQTASSGDDFVKPAALATMTVTGALAGRTPTGTPSTGIPHTLRADFSATTGGTTALSALWSDGLPVDAAVTVTSHDGSAVPVGVTTEYGSTTTVQVASGSPYRLALSSQVALLTYPVGDTLSVGPTEPYGTDVASAAAGASATASSGTAAAAIAGDPAGYGNGWSSATGDITPSLTDTFAHTTTIDRIVVDTQSVGSIASGVRNYTLAADVGGTWTTVATETGQYRYHTLQFSFPPVAASGIRISVSEVNFGGYYGGGIPPWWPAGQISPAFLHSIEAYAGSGGEPAADGTALPSLLSASASGGGTTPTTTTTTTTTLSPTTTTTTIQPATTTTTEPTTTTTTTRPPATTTTTTTTQPPAVGTGDPAPARQRLKGYWLTLSDGGIFTFGAATSLGSAVGLGLDKPVVDMVSTPDDKGYWMVSSDGGIFTFGDAGFYGSTGGWALNKPIVGMASTADGRGYWLVASDGGIFSFGDARYLGSTGAITLNKPIVHMAATPDGAGYWLVASDGGVFTFGDAGFFGSTGALRLNKPIVGMAATPDGRGYWMVATDGGVFTFGDAGFFGSTGGLTLNAPVTGIQDSPTGAGYWLVASDGGIFSFGDAAYYGSAGGQHLSHPTVAIS